MNLGLLQGLGRGISQGAEMVNRGMQEDRAVAREEERERMRQASIEKRWKIEDSRYADSKAAQDRAEKRQVSQDEKADKRYVGETEYRKGRDSKADQQFNAQMGVREKQLIESNLTGIMDSEARAAEKIRQMYEKRMQSGTEDPAALEAKMQAELESSQMYYSDRLGKAIQSYGPQLKGTSFSYLLDISEPAQQEEVAAPPPEAQAQKPAFDRNSFITEQLGAAPAAAQTMAPGLSTDPNGAPELTFSNLMKKWSTPSADSPARPGLLSPEVIQQQQQFNDKLKQSNIKSAYGAAFLQNQGR